MFLALVLILGVLGKCTAIPLSGFPQNEVGTRSPAIEAILLDLLEDLRDTMLNGSDDVPVLDPFQAEHIEIDGDDIGVPGLSLDLYDFVLRQLSTFEVHSLNVRTIFPLLRYSVSFDGSIPLLECDVGEYKLDSTVAGVNIFGNGQASVLILNPNLSGSITVGVRITISNGLFLNVFNANLRLQLGGFKSNIRGIFFDEAVSDFVNMFLEYFVPDLFVHYEDEISGFLNEMIPDIANEILHDLDLDDILRPGLLSEIMLQNSK